MCESMSERKNRLWQDRWRAAVCGLTDSSGTRTRGARRRGRRSVMMMSRCSAAAKMDWPKLGLIKSQGWRCSSADIINIEMIMAEQFGSAEPNQFWLWGTHIRTVTGLSCSYVHICICVMKELIWDAALLQLSEKGRATPHGIFPLI